MHNTSLLIFRFTSLSIVPKILEEFKKKVDNITQANSFISAKLSEKNNSQLTRKLDIDVSDR